MHSYLYLFIRNTTILLFSLSYVHLHAASQATAGSSGEKYILTECRDAAELYKQDMKLCYKVLKGVYTDLAAIPGLKPSNLPVVLSPRDFVMQLNGLQVLNPSDCSAHFLANVGEYDAIFSKALGKTGDSASAWRAAQKHLKRTILGTSNEVVGALVRYCTTNMGGPIFVESITMQLEHAIEVKSITMQLEQLQGDAIEYVEQ